MKRKYRMSPVEGLITLFAFTGFLFIVKMVIEFVGGPELSWWLVAGPLWFPLVVWTAVMLLKLLLILLILILDLFSILVGK